VLVFRGPSDASPARQEPSGTRSLLLGFLLLGLQPLFVKLADRYGFSPAESVMIRFGITLGLALASALLLGQSLRTQRPWIWLLRGVLGGGAVLLFFTSVALSGASVGTLLNYTYPVWAQLFAFTIGERVRLESLAYLALALFGVYLVVQPSSQSFGVGEVSGIFSGILAGGAVLCLKKLRETDGEQTIIVSFSLIGIVFAVGLLVWQRGSVGALREHSAQGWLVELVVGLLSFLGHVYFTRGYKYTTVRVGSVLSLLVPLIAAITGVLFLGETVSASFVLGALLILASVLIATRRDRPRIA
jgi:drug/metabolite transporter (DMT)-like permease